MHNNKFKKSPSKIAKRRKARKYAGTILMLIIPVIIIIGLIYVLRADFLQIKSFQISGTENIPQEDIKNTAVNFISGNKFLFIPKSDVLFLNKENLAATLISKFPRLEKIEVDKAFFNNQIELKVTERKADFLWCSTDNQCFFMAENGLVFEKAGFTESYFLTSSTNWIEPLNKMIFKGNLEGNPLMKNFSTPAKIQNYLKLVEVFKNAGFEVLSINIESKDRAVAKANVGNIIFNPEEADLSLVAQNAILLINEVRSKNPSAIFNYIDARFGTKLFYKVN